MDAIFMNSKNSKTLEVHRLLLLNLADKMIEVIKRSDKYVALSNLSMYYTWKNRKKSYKNNQFKIEVQHGMKRLNNQIDCILCQIFNVILSILSKT